MDRKFKIVVERLVDFNMLSPFDQHHFPELDSNKIVVIDIDKARDPKEAYACFKHQFPIVRNEEFNIEID
jgi:hypothetical protein